MRMYILSYNISIIIWWGGEGGGEEKERTNKDKVINNIRVKYVYSEI